MANPEHVEIVRQGTDAIRRWYVEKHAEFGLDLVKADLGGLNMENSDLSWSDLREANLSGAVLIRANFTGARVEGANMNRTSLSDARLHNTLIRGTSFRDANVICADIRECYFAESDWSGALFGGTMLAGCSLKGAIGLSEAHHVVPSIVSIDTILRSEGDIPPEFLHGCGLPDEAIAFAREIAKNPPHYYSCFLSHSAKDAAFVNYFRERLKEAGVERWYFPDNARIGRKLWSEIRGAIRGSDKLVIVCSRNSMESAAVIKEIDEGLAYEQEEAARRLGDFDKVKRGELSNYEFQGRRYHTQVLFPITIDDYIFDSWQHPLKHELQKNRVIGDFRDWEDFKTFDKAFKKLLKDLNSED